MKGIQICDVQLLKLFGKGVKFEYKWAVINHTKPSKPLQITHINMNNH